jgi:hypothetical protein
MMMSDPELDLRTKMGPRRPKNKSAWNGFKPGMCAGLIDTRDKMNIVGSRYRVLVIFPKRQKGMMTIQSV